MIRAAETPWSDVGRYFEQHGGLAILPFGALEQHGPHLPLATDTLTAQFVATAVAQATDAVLLPAVPYGQTWNNAGYPGTVSLAPETVTAIAVDIGRALPGSNCRALVIVNGDWGNRAPLSAAAEILNAERASSGKATATLVLDYPGMDAAVERVRESRPAFPGLAHAEEVETSIMLAIDGRLVEADRYVSEYPDFPAGFGEVPMQLHPFSASGVFGDPATASEAKGAAILEATIAASTDAVRTFLDRL